MKKEYVDIKLLLAIALALVFIINFYFMIDIGKKLAKPEIKIPEVSVSILEDTSCKDCYDVSNLIGLISKQKVNITGQQYYEYTSDNGKQLASKYNIDYAPAVIVTGNITSLNVNGFTQIGDALVSSKLAPYRDLTTNQVVGLVSLTYINISCDNCFNIYSLVDQLKQIGVKISSQQIIQSTSSEAQNLIAKYNLTRLPALVLSNDAAAYSALANAWGQIGFVANDKSYITSYNIPPYYDVQNNTVVGLVNLTYLTDNSCTGCYNVKQHKQIVQRFGVYLNNEQTVDASDSLGQQLIKRYDITEVPTIILSKDASYYTALTSAWKSVGSVESDGSYIFRNVSLMGGYFDLTANKFVNATK